MKSLFLLFRLQILQFKFALIKKHVYYKKKKKKKINLKQKKKKQTFA